MYMYGAVDDKWVKTTTKTTKKISSLDSYTFCREQSLQLGPTFKKHDVPLVFKATPDTLLNLCCKIVDQIKLPSVYQWTNVDVCRWIKRYGYPQYIATFRDNYVNGRTLLLLTASNLSQMNIKNFDDIRHIAKGIRSLFFFEMTKFTRSISLAPEYHHELYKLFRVKNGPKYEETRRSDLWRQLQMIREKSPNYSHWEMLERWLAMKKDPRYQELIGGAPRTKLYRCHLSLPPPHPKEEEKHVFCGCVPPCSCCWEAEAEMRQPWRLSFLPPRDPNKAYLCPVEIDIDTLGFKKPWHLQCLQHKNPDKYDIDRLPQGNIAASWRHSYLKLLIAPKSSMDFRVASSKNNSME